MAAATAWKRVNEILEIGEMKEECMREREKEMRIFACEISTVFEGLRSFPKSTRNFPPIQKQRSRTSITNNYPPTLAATIFEIRTSFPLLRSCKVSPFDGRDCAEYGIAIRLVAMMMMNDLDLYDGLYQRVNQCANN